MTIPGISFSNVILIAVWISSDGWENGVGGVPLLECQWASSHAYMVVVGGSSKANMYVLFDFFIIVDFRFDVFGDAGLSILFLDDLQTLCVSFFR